MIASEVLPLLLLLITFTTHAPLSALPYFSWTSTEPTFPLSVTTSMLLHPLGGLIFSFGVHTVVVASFGLVAWIWLFATTSLGLLGEVHDIQHSL